MPADAQWIELWTPEPVDRDADTIIARIRPLNGGEFERPIGARPFKPLHGFTLHAAGYVSEETPRQDHAQPWEIGPRIWGGLDLPGFILNVTHLQVTWPGAPLRFERHWLSGQYIEDRPIIVRGGATPADYHRLADAFEALGRFSELLGNRRGPRSYDRDQERREIYQKIANRLHAHRQVSRVALATDLALTPDGFDDKRKRCELTLDELLSLTLERLAALGINPETDPIQP